jgi:hypothetical protein
MFFWIYDIPNWVLGALLTAFCVGYTWLGILLFRRRVRRWLGPQPGENELVSYFLSAFGVFYGLALGLIAVATYQSYSDADSAVGKEATSLAALYSDVSGYPEPARGNYQEQLREYTRFVIEKTWPLHKRGILHTGGTKLITKLQTDLFGFQPKTKAEEIIHAQTLSQFNVFIEARRLRLQHVTTGLPTVLWYVVAMGAALNLALLWMFSVDRLSVHLALSGVLAAFVGMMLFFIAAMDNPFRGEVSISPEAFQIVQESLMTPGAKASP